MKKGFYILFLILIHTQSTLFAQRLAKDSLKGYGRDVNYYIPTHPLTRKGQMFVFFGWNRDIFSKSDIYFTGNGYDFQLDNVKAIDKPHPIDMVYINPTKFTVVQYDFRIGYFIKDNLALVLGIDHMKYVMMQDQTVKFSGHISDPTYANMVQNGEINLADEKFLTFEHTDGLNYENLGLEKTRPLSHSKHFDLIWSYGAGFGVMFPKSNVKLFGNERSDRFHVAGMGTDIRSSLNLVFNRHLMVRLEGKAGRINMWDIKTTLNNKPDKAQQDFVFGQILAGVGYTFNTRK